MFRSKSLLCCKKAAALGSNLATKPSKPSIVNLSRVINYNKENRYLFGELLEKHKRHRKTTKQERARSLMKTADGETKAFSNKCSTGEGKPQLRTNREIVSEMRKDVLRAFKENDRASSDGGAQSLQGHKIKDETPEALPLKVDLSNKPSKKATNGKNDSETANQHITRDKDSTTKGVFPLINSEKCSLNYEDSIKHIINISYENVDKELFSSIPSVGKVLRETMPQSARIALERWKKNMIAELGEEGFEKLNKANLQRGVLFHDCVRRYMIGETVKEHELPEKVRCYFKSLEELLPRLSNVAVVESHVVHPELSYRGFVDGVAEYNGTPVIIEWKLTDKPKPHLSSMYDAPLQMSAYLGALNYDKNYKIPVQCGIVVAAYTDGSPADVFFLPEKECEKHWKKFHNRLINYQQV